MQTLKFSARLFLFLSMLSLPYFLCSKNLQANLWQTATSLKKGAASAGAYGAYGFSGSVVEAVGQVSYGVISSVQVEGRLFLSGGKLGLGAYGKYFLISHKLADISIWGGVDSVAGGTALSLAPILSKAFSHFQVYLAPVFEYALSNSRLNIGLIPGMSVAAFAHALLFVELSVGNSSLPNSASLGLNYFF